MTTPASPSPTIRRRVIISGQVQGVWFRASCATEAERLAISGTVRNREDGTIEGDFEGAADAVAALIAWCQDGPEHAQVDDVAVVDARPIGYADFRVL